MKRFAKPSPTLSRKQLILAGILGMIFYFAIIIFSETRSGKVLNYNFATTAEFWFKKRMEKMPDIDPRIKILSVSDHSIAFLNRSNLYFHEWVQILNKISEFKPDRIIVDKIFGVANFYSSAARHTASEAKPVPVPVITGAFISPEKIPKRTEVDYEHLISAIRDQLNLDFSLADAGKETVTPMIKEIKSSVIYAGHSSLNTYFSLNGFFNYNGQLKFNPLVKTRTGHILPFAGILAASSVEMTNTGIFINNTRLPVDRDGELLINLVDKESFYKQVKPLLSIKKYGSYLKKGDIVIILPGMYTGGTDFHDSPIGYVPGGFFITSIINSVLQGGWISYTNFNWLIIGCFAVLGIATAVYLASSIYWLSLLIISTMLVASGLASFTWLNLVIPWLWALMCFFSLSLMVFFFKSIYIEKIKEISDEMKDIMNSIDQIIFTFNPDYSLNSEFSRMAGEVYDKALFSSHQQISHLFQLSAKEITDFNSWIDLMFKTSQPKKWNRFLKLNPHKFLQLNQSGSKRIFQSDYQPVLRNNKIVKIMGILTDVTRAKEAEEKLAKTEAEHRVKIERFMVFIHNDREMILRFLSESETMLNDFNQIKAIDDVKEKIHLIFRRMHTFKGNAGSIGLKILSNMAHQAESLLSELRDHGAPESFSQNWESCIQTMQEELKKLMEIKTMVFRDELENLNIDRDLYSRTLSEISQRDDTEEKYFSQKILDLNAIRFSLCMNKYQNIINYFREQSGISLEDLQINTPGVMVNRDIFAVFDQALVHLIRNAVDHGIEPQDIREKAGKGPGRIAVSYEKRGTREILIVSDDGAGIDPEVIFSKARQKGLPAASENLSDSEKINLIFSPGFSTRNESDEISGRGVGLDAVADVIRKAGGGISISSSPGAGTKFELWLPASLKYQNSSLFLPESLKVSG